MSGEWIPIHKELCDEIVVIQMAGRLKLDAYAVAGRLFQGAAPLVCTRLTDFT